MPAQGAVAYCVAMATTSYEINSDRDRLVSRLRGTLSLHWIEYRGFHHPQTRTEMRPEIATAVENDLQRWILSHRIKDSRFLKLSASRYITIEPYSSVGRASKRFIRFSSALDRNFLAPRGIGFDSGVPFWGNVSTSLIRAPDLAEMLSKDEALNLRDIASRTSRPDFSNVFYSGPEWSGTVDESGRVVGDGSPHFRSSPVVLGSYGGSTRLRVDAPPPQSDSQTLFPELSLAQTVPFARQSAFDVWGKWAEIVPFPSSAGPAIPVDVERLISGLWGRVDDIGAQQAQSANELQWALTDLAGSLAGQGTGRVRATLTWLLSAVMAIALGAAGSGVWEFYGDQIRELIRRLG
jgi:hypothetical protein